MTRKLKSAATTTLKAALAVGLLYYVFTSGKISLDSLKALLTPTVIAGGVAVLGLVLGLAAERWRVFLSHQSIPAHRKSALQLTMVGNFFNFFVPGGVGGDIVKALLIARHHPSQKSKAVLTVLADRVLGFFTMTLLALIAFAFEPGLLTRETSFQFVFLGLIALFSGFLFAFWLLLSHQAKALRLWVEKLSHRSPRLHSVWLSAQSYRLNPSQLFKVMALSLGSQLSQILLFIVVSTQISPQLPPITVFLFAVPLGFMVTAIPIAPAGIGIGQAAFFYLFSKAMGTETNLGVIGVTAFQAFQLFYGLIGAAIFVVMKREDSALSIEQLEAEGVQP